LEFVEVLLGNDFWGHERDSGDAHVQKQNLADCTNLGGTRPKLKTVVQLGKKKIRMSSI
jgi:hypothetical protein